VTVTFVILFFLVLGAATLFQSAVSYGILHVSMMHTDRRYLSPDRERVKQLLLGLSAIVNLLIGVGFLAGKRWARNLGVAVCGINALIILISTIMALVWALNMAGFFATNTSVPTSSTVTALFLLSRLGEHLHYLWVYAFVGCLLLKDRALRRYISSSTRT
jgi:hypothetical protein